MSYLTYAQATKRLKEYLEHLNSIADEDWIVESFVADNLLTELNNDTYQIETGTIIYGLVEMGLQQLAIEFENWLDSNS